MAADETTFAWYQRDAHWSRSGLLLAVALLLLSPLVYPTLGLSVFLIFLQLPIYMFHQYEEHGHGAFKAFVNRTVLAGRPQLTDGTIFWINILGVWGVDGCAVYLAHYGGVSLGLVAPYLAMVNGVIHAGMAARQRRYNPGLWTAISLLIPGGIVAIGALVHAGGVTAGAHAIGLGAAIMLHIITIASMGAFAAVRASRRA